jgi:hypothetical protein
MTMLNITTTAETSASPQQVLTLAGTDFSSRRAKILPNVTTRRLEVHNLWDTFAEVTEGATGIARFAWERTRYDWSQPGVVKQTVLDSNVVEPGSTWELRVMPRTGGGSVVEMTLARRFRPSLAGRYGSMLNHLAGRPGWRSFLRRALKAVEHESAAAGHPARDVGSVAAG